jgi:hypothetical protein
MMVKIVMLLLVLYPILGIYKLPIGVDIPINSLLFFFVFIAVITSNKKLIFKYPQGFVIYWLYISFVYLFFSDSFKLTMLIPGGLSFCLWVIAFLICAQYFDYKLFRRYYKIVFIVCAIVFYIQEISYISIGYRPIFLLPLPLSGDTDYSEILANYINLDRSSCFFREPSHFAQFTLPLLAIELMDPPKINKLFTPFSIFLILTLIFLRSGNGFLGLIILVAIRLWSYIKHVRLRTKLITIFFIIPLILALSALYIKTEQGADIANRATGISTDEDSSSFMRTFRGYFLYADLPTINKVFGTSLEEIPKYIAKSRVSYLFVSPKTGEPDQYLNGIQTILVSNGLVGLLLFLIVYYRLSSHNNMFSKSLVYLFISLLLIGNLYLSHIMLISTVVPWLIKRNRFQLFEKGADAGLKRT